MGYQSVRARRIMRQLAVVYLKLLIFFFRQKTAYDMRISGWSADVCSSDLPQPVAGRRLPDRYQQDRPAARLGIDQPAVLQQAAHGIGAELHRDTGDVAGRRGAFVADLETGNDLVQQGLAGPGQPVDRKSVG